MKHSSPALFFITLFLGLMATVCVAEMAIQFHRDWLFIPAFGLAMIIAMWMWILLPPKTSARERRRMELIMNLQNEQASLDAAIEKNDLISERMVRQRIAQIKDDPDFSYTSLD